MASQATKHYRYIQGAKLLTCVGIVEACKAAPSALAEAPPPPGSRMMGVVGAPLLGCMTGVCRSAGSSAGEELVQRHIRLTRWGRRLGGTGTRERDRSALAEPRGAPMYLEMRNPVFMA